LDAGGFYSIPVGYRQELAVFGAYTDVVSGSNFCEPLELRLS